jgi:multidrug efflux pump subunit AcrB
MVALNEGHAPTADYVRRLRTRLNHEFPGTLFYFLPADIVSQTLNFGLPAPFDVQFIGMNQVSNRALAVRLADQIKKIPGATDLRVNQPDNLPQLHITVDRSKAMGQGLTDQSVASAVLLGLSGSSQVQPEFWLDPKVGVQYSINVRATEIAMDSVQQLKAMPISVSQPGAGSAQILENVAQIDRINVPPVVSHYGIKPVIDVYGNVDGRDLGGVLTDMQPLVDKIKKDLPRGSSLIVRGQAETMHSSYVGLGIGLAGAIVLIYFLLVVNFQSWLDPFIIITALPGALAGVVWGLWLSQTTLSVPALMGAIMSMGVATANSVLVVTFARENLRRGLDPIQAALEAGAGRIRPILMTALAMVIGMLPLSLGLGEGGEQNAPLGRAVIGGLIFATVATLFFVPVIFSFMHRRTPAADPIPAHPPVTP